MGRLILAPADLPQRWVQMKRTIREEAIEECAQVAQQWLIRAEQGSGEDLIDAIRALKDKP